MSRKSARGGCVAEQGSRFALQGESRIEILAVRTGILCYVFVTRGYTDLRPRHNSSTGVYSQGKKAPSKISMSIIRICDQVKMIQTTTLQISVVRGISGITPDPFGPTKQ